MKNRIITISREFGSGGRTIGKEVAEKLGIPCYDSELIDKFAEESGLAKEYVAERGELTSSGGWFASAFTDRDYNGQSSQDYLWGVQVRVISELAEKGPCVIVGRCADRILADKEDVLSVFIHAPLEFRAKRIVEVYGEREDSPEKRIKDKDKRRKAFHRFYAESEWGLASNYTISLDSSAVGIEKCVELIASLY